MGDHSVVGEQVSEKGAAERDRMLAGVKIVELPRVLTALDLIVLGVGSTVGAGIFVLCGQAAAKYAGPAVILSFVLSGICCSFYGLCYAELASMVPVAGSAYTYSKVAFGRLTSWVIGWNLLLEYLFGAATVAVGWSGYLVSQLKDWGLDIHGPLSMAPVEVDENENFYLTGAICNVPAVFIVACCTIVLCVGIRESTRTNMAFVAVKLTVLALFIFMGMWFVKAKNYEPFIPENTGKLGHFGWSGVLRGSSVIFFAYIGFDALTTVASETINPQRNLPIGILGSLFLCTALYVATSAVLTGLVSYKELLVPDPMAVGVDAAGDALSWLRPFIKLGALAGLTSVILVGLLGQPRIIQVMAADGLLPPALAAVHEASNTPRMATVMCGLLCSLVAGTLPINILGELVSIGTLLAFLIVCAGVLMLRWDYPDAPRPFRLPFHPLIPGIGVVLCSIQMISLPVGTWMRLAIWVTIGMVVYAMYGHKRVDYVAVETKENDE
mmetsp:Transcript_12433/g.28674  ORF Transcript_12433/g.28674 Transcript_12433/m.28674 type:complete len:497 (+) Transcript_12433:3-1493(+)